MAISLSDLKTKLTTTTPKPTPSANGSVITTKIKVESVSAEERLNKNGKPYDMVNVVYRNDKGQIKERNFPAFTPFGKQAIEVLQEDSEFSITMEKGESGFWEWQTIVPA